MSYYLVERIKAQPNIEVLTRSEVTAHLKFIYLVTRVIAI
jgi:hypothetical protein